MTFIHHRELHPIFIKDLHCSRNFLRTIFQGSPQKVNMKKLWSFMNVSLSAKKIWLVPGNFRKRHLSESAWKIDMKNLPIIMNAILSSWEYLLFQEFSENDIWVMQQLTYTFRSASSVTTSTFPASCCHRVLKVHRSSYLSFHCWCKKFVQLHEQSSIIKKKICLNPGIFQEQYFSDHLKKLKSKSCGASWTLVCQQKRSDLFPEIFENDIWVSQPGKLIWKICPSSWMLFCHHENISCSKNFLRTIFECCSN